MMAETIPQIDWTDFFVNAIEIHCLSKEDATQLIEACDTYGIYTDSVQAEDVITHPYWYVNAYRELLNSRFSTPRNVTVPPPTLQEYIQNNTRHLALPIEDQQNILKVLLNIKEMNTMIGKYEPLSRF